jgi:cyclopropane fatty-acyl-phospholipid synthase-like methyltransferase
VRDLLYTIENKDAFVAKINRNLKPRGHLLLTDFNSMDEEILFKQPITLWLEKEPYGAHLITLPQMMQILEKHGFDVRVNEDITKTYISLALKGLLRLTSFLEGKKLNLATKALLREEVDLWTCRLAALETGITNNRFYAIKVR